MPWVKCCLPHDIVLPWGAKSIDDAEWVAHRVVRHVDEIKADVKYSHTKNLSTVMSKEDFMGSYLSAIKAYRAGKDTKLSTGTGTADVQFCELFEIHHKRTGKIYVIAVGHDKFLRSDENTLQTNAGLPFVSFSFVPALRSFWVTPDSYYLKQCQQELNDIALQTTKNRRLSIVKFLYQEGSLDDDQLDNALDSTVGVGIRVKQGIPLREAITTFNPTNVNSMLYQDAEYTRRNSREMVGFSRNQMGEYEQSGRRTASEAMLVQQGSSARVGRRQGIIGDAYVDVFRKMNKIQFVHWHTPRWVQAVGINGEQFWSQVNGNLLQGDFLYNYSFSSEPVVSQSSRLQQAVGAYQTLGGDPTVNQEVLHQNLQTGMNKPGLQDLFKEGVNNADIPASMPQSKLQGQPQGA